MPVETHIFATEGRMAEAAAMRLLTLVREKPDAVIGLASGGTPTIVYERLAALAQDTDFSGVSFFALDEYVGLPRDHPQSYRRYFAEKVLTPLGIDPARFTMPDGMAPDRAGAAARYEAALAAAGGVDLWLAGIGHNGHLAFNEPGSPFDSRTRDVTLSETTRAANARFFAQGDSVPERAITVGLGTLAEHAREVMLLVRGAAKAEILARALQGPVGEDVPASILQEMNTSLWADEAAAGALTSRPA